MSEYTIKPLGPKTWDAFARLCEKHNGMGFGGCWCTWFHRSDAGKGPAAEGNRSRKERLVNEGRAHAALVFDGDVAVGWCQYGIPDELPNIYHRCTRPVSYPCLITALPASSWTGITGAKG